MSGTTNPDATPDLQPPPPLLAWAGRAVLAALVVIFARNAWRQIPIGRTPPPDRAAQLEALVRDRQPEGRDGWDDLLAAFERFRTIPLDIPAAERTDARRERFPWNDGRVEWDLPFAAKDEPGDAPDLLDPIFAPEHRAAAALETSGTLAALDAAATAPRFVRPIRLDESEMLVMMELPELAAARQLAKALRLHALLAAARGDWATAERDDARIRTIARALGPQATLIDGLVSAAILHLERELRETLADDPRTPAATLRSLLAIEDAIPVPLDARRSLAGERIAIADTIDSLYTDDGRGDGVLRPNMIEDVTGGMPGGLTIGGALLRSRRETVAAFDAYFAMLDQNLGMSAVERRARGHDLDAWIGGLGPRHMVVRFLLPALSRVVDNYDAMKAENGAARVRLALEIVRRERGAIDADVAGIVPDPLAALPVEPFNGGPLRLAERTREDGARTIVVYAPGLDGIDHGGDPDADMVYREIPIEPR